MSTTELSELAKRIPWQFQIHMSGPKEHAIMYRNDALNLQCEGITKYRNGNHGKSRRYFYVNEKNSTIFNSMEELFNAMPEIEKLAERLYPVGWQE